MPVVKEMALLDKVSEELAPGPLAVPTINISAMFERLAANPDIDVAKLQALVDMQLQLLALQAKAQFNEAFAAMQNELPVIAESVKGDKWHYAPREDIIEAVRPILFKHGFSLAHKTEWPEGKGVKVIAILAHRLGHERTSEFQTPADKSGSKNDVQALGSATEYGRRYTTVDVLGIATGKDDNGQRAGKPQKDAPEGYSKWLTELTLTAPNGLAALQHAFQAGAREFREYLTTVDSARHAELKEKARKVKA